MSTKPHTPECFVYQYAEALIGADRRGLCTCGAEQANYDEPCTTCGQPTWHPPWLCWAYRWLDADTIERIAADVLRFAFEEPDIATWESEGGR